MLCADGSDNGTDTYDSSEKARIPAWTDRILARGPLEQSAYDRAELRSSDHRPVYAIYRAEVRQVDEERKARIRREVTEKGEVAVGSEAVGRVLDEKRECEWCRGRVRADGSGT